MTKMEETTMNLKTRICFRGTHSSCNAGTQLSCSTRWWLQRTVSPVPDNSRSMGNIGSLFVKLK